MIRTILVALDSSERAPRVLAAAVEIGGRFGATLIPVRAVNVPPDFPPAAHLKHGDPLPDFLVREATDDLKRVVASVTAGAAPPVGAPVVRLGQPWRVIVAVADELAVDLIVLGSHGYHPIDRLLGTTAGKVANIAHRNVLVIHDPARPHPPATPASAP
jgi:nucleotide-binding universal stress UspA family protein